MPGSPRTTSTRLRPARTSASSPSRASHCCLRPHNITQRPFGGSPAIVGLLPRTEPNSIVTISDELRLKSAGRRSLMTLTVTEAGLALADPAVYADEARLHEALTLLRGKAPVHRVRAPGFEPFWAITRHGDIMEIERQNSLFLNAPRPLLATAEMDAIAEQREAEGTA